MEVSRKSVQAEHCSNPACLAERQSLVQEIQSLKRKISSLESENQRATSLHGPQTTSESSRHHLEKSHRDLLSTLTKEREQFEHERKQWNSFKRKYAEKVVKKLNDITNKFVDQPKNQLPQPLHPLITLALQTHEQQKQRAPEFFQAESHVSPREDPPHPHQLNDKKDGADPPADGSSLVSPSHLLLPKHRPLTGQDVHQPRFSARRTSDVPQQSSHESSRSTRALSDSQPKPSSPIPTEKLCNTDGTEPRSQKTPTKKTSHLSPAVRRVPSDKCSPALTSRGRRGISPEKDRISPRKNALSPGRGRMSPGRNGTNPGRNAISPRRSALSPRRNGTTPKNGLPSVTRTNQFSLRLKPQHDGRVNKNHDFTPQLARKRSASSVTSRPKLPTPKWIKYSDRKARAGQAIFNDHEDDTAEPRPEKLKRQPMKATEDVFRVESQQKRIPQEEATLNQGKHSDLRVIEPSSEDLPTTEESDTESISAAVKKGIPLISKRVNEQRVNPSVPSIETGLISKEEKMKDTSREEDSNKTGGDNVDAEDSDFEEYPGQNLLRKIHKERKLKSASKKKELIADDDSIVNVHDQFEIDPKNNFGVNHVFDEVARGKQVRKTMHARDCECCSGYYEQAAKDLNQFEQQNGGDCSKVISEHQHQISRHRHFNPPPMTPPGFWQMGFPDTQEVENINQRAEDNKRAKMKNIQMQAKEGVGPYKYKENSK